MKNSLKSLLVRICGLGFVISAITVALFAAGIPHLYVCLTWVFFAIGVLVVGEVYLVYSGRSGQREDVGHGLIEVGLLVVSAVAFFWILHPLARKPDQPEQITIKLSNKVEDAIVQIEKDLAAYLERDHTPIPTRAQTSVPIVMWGAMALAVLLLFVAFMKRGHQNSKEVPIAALTTAIVAVLGAMEKLPKLNGYYFKFALWGPAVAAALLLLMGAWQLTTGGFKAWSSEKGDATWHFVVVGLSFGLLSWLALWASPTSTIATPPPTVAYEPKLLNAKIRFDPGSAKVSRVELLRTEIEIKNTGKPGDILLLLGSTECSRIKIKNTLLAKNRAQKVTNSLGKLDLPVVPYAALQHESCKPDEKLRAVFPVLLQAQNR